MTEPEIVHLAIGGIAALIFLLQNLGSLTGGADAPDADFGGHPGDFHDGSGSGDEHSLYGYLSIRNLVAFFMGYGWVAFAALRADFTEISSALAGVGAGLVLVFVSVLLLRIFSRFQEDGTLKAASLAGKSCTVYIAIGAAGSKAGKVLVDTPAGRVELTARTSSARNLKAGEVVEIERTESGALWVKSPAPAQGAPE